MFPDFVALLLLANVCALIYLFFIWNIGYWKRRGIQEAKSHLFYGSFPGLINNKRSVVYDIDEIYRKYKNNENFVGVHICREPMLMTLSSEYAHRIYVTDFGSFNYNDFVNYVGKDEIFGNNPFLLKGEAWKERRAELMPGLTANRIAAAYPVTLEVVKNFSDFIREQTKMGNPDGIDTRDVCLRYTTDIVSDCVLGIKARSFADDPTPIIAMVRKGFKLTCTFIIYLAVGNIFPVIRKFYRPAFVAKDVQVFFKDLMKTSINLRRRMPEQQRRVDFLNYILHLQDKKNLSLADLTSHTMTFLTDGFETTALVLAHCLLLLARYPDKQQKLRREIGEKEHSFNELNEMPYLEACINESVRIFAPLLLGRKTCTKNYEFINKNGNKLVLKAGQTVIVPIYSLHHDESIYEDPETFIPERFLPENGGVKKYRDMGAFFGFGDGPRSCLGMRFALTQIKAAIIEIVQNFDIKMNTKTRTDNRLDDQYFIGLLKGGIWLNFEDRK